jgi:hypothetical protein
MPDELLNPIVFYKNRIYHIKVGEKGEYSHCFGGESLSEFKGQKFAPRKLHRLLTLDLSDPIFTNIYKKLERLELYYGFCYDSCELNYTIRNSMTIEVNSIEPNKSDDDWPYDCYPSSFEQKYAVLSRPEECKYNVFLDLIWQNFVDDYSDKMIIVIPPSNHYGVSLWGEMGDDEGVQVVFVVDTTSNTVQAFNQCT